LSRWRVKISIGTELILEIADLAAMAAFFNFVLLGIRILHGCLLMVMLCLAHKIPDRLRSAAETRTQAAFVSSSVK